jgi:hypothetical protein
VREAEGKAESEVDEAAAGLWEALELDSSSEMS